MATLGDEDYDDYDECLDQIWLLKKGNERLKASFKKIDELLFETKKFKKMLSDNADDVNVKDYPPLDTFDSTDRLVTENLETLRTSMAGIEDKMDSLKDVHELWIRDKNYVCNLLEEIRNIQKSIDLKMNDFDNDKDINLIMDILETKRKEW